MLMTICLVLSGGYGAMEIIYFIISSVMMDLNGKFMQYKVFGLVGNFLPSYELRMHIMT